MTAFVVYMKRRTHSAKISNPMYQNVIVNIDFLFALEILHRAVDSACVCIIETTSSSRLSIRNIYLTKCAHFQHVIYTVNQSKVSTNECPYITPCQYKGLHCHILPCGRKKPPKSRKNDVLSSQSKCV